MRTDPTPTDPHTLLAALARDQGRLELGTFDICCLAALHLRAERDDSCFASAPPASIEVVTDVVGRATR